MAITHNAVLATVLLALLALPWVVAVVLRADDRATKRAWTRHGCREIEALRHLERDLTALEPELCLPDFEPTIDELVAELRRLDHQRRSSLTTGSAAWLAAVLRAYDRRLEMASQHLGLTEHLGKLEGMDRDIERIRVEGLLQAAGLRLRAS